MSEQQPSAFSAANDVHQFSQGLLSGCSRRDFGSSDLGSGPCAFLCNLGTNENTAKKVLILGRVTQDWNQSAVHAAKSV